MHLSIDKENKVTLVRGCLIEDYFKFTFSVISENIFFVLSEEKKKNFWCGVSKVNGRS